MNILVWALTLSTLLTIITQAVTFHRVTVCRQIAWLSSTKLITRKTLTNTRPQEREWHVGCRQLVESKEKGVSWKTYPGFIRHNFSVRLEGKL